MTIEEWLGDYPLGIDIWNKKYRYNNETLDEWFDRVSGGDQELRKLIVEKKFLFGGRTLANRGTNKGSYSNCYCSGRVSDSLEEILQTNTEIALTFKAQGGQGLSLSNIRPKGSNIGDNFKSDGIIPFMEIFNTTTHSISQGGSRKGALMMSLDAEHPQIKDFIIIKSDLNRINNANLSVEINDRFMEAVKKYYETGETVKYTIPNKFKGGNPEGYEICPIDIYKLIIKQAHDTAEPGVMFMNKFSNYNLMEYVDDYQIHTSNPCGEQPLPKNAACCLSSINLSEYVLNPFTKDAKFDFKSFSKDIYIYVKNADKIIDESANLHALQKQKEFALNYRNIGIGIMGLGSMFLKLGIRFGSKESLIIAKEIGKTMFRYAIIASSELAESLGVFPKYTDKVFDSTIIKNHFSPEEINILRQNGLRNASLLSIAPTGSIGTMLGISTGAEEYFSDSYYRKTISLDSNGEKYYKIDLPIYKKARESEIDPKVIVTVHDIPWRERIDMQSVLQYSIDTAISSTCNLSKDTTTEEIEQIYLYAWKQGLKGFTIYVDGCRDGVLVSLDSVEKNESSGEDSPKFDYITPVSRKILGTTIGTTSCRKCACGTLYITCNKDQDGNLVEVFTHTSKGGICQANMNAVTRLISLNLRSGVKVEEIIDQIKGINCPACTTCKARGINIDGLSCPDIISKTIKESLDKVDLKINIPSQSIKNESDKTTPPNIITTSFNDKCPECGEPLIATGGCVSCIACGWSRCS